MRLHFDAHMRVFVAFLSIAFVAAVFAYAGSFFVRGALWKKADQSFSRGDYPQAIRYFGMINRLDRYDVQAYQLKSWLEWSIAREQCRVGEDFSRALDCSLNTVRNGRKANPYAWELFLEEGQIWECFGEDGKAAECYRAVFLYGPTPYSRLYPQMLAKCGRTGEACDAMRAICADRNDQMSGRQLKSLSTDREWSLARAP